MKNLILVVIAFFTLNVVAQEKKVTAKHDKAEALAKIETKKLTEQLELDAEQVKKVYSALVTHFKEEPQRKQKIKKMMTSKRISDKAEIKKAMVKHKQGSSEKLENQLKEILTPEQYKSYAETHLKEQKTKNKVMTNKN